MTLEDFTKSDNNLLEHLSQFVSEDRRAKIDEILNQRTRYLTAVVENLFQPHNASAILRSAECFGIQDVHIIENEHHFKPMKGISVGSTQWLNLSKYKSQNAPQECIKTLKSQGYHIVGTVLSEKAVPLPKYEITKHKTALCFGTEKEGLSQTMIDLCDTHIIVPMQGFTQSFNVSVTAALCFFDLTRRLRESNINYQLSENEKNHLRLNWYKKSIRNAEMIIERFESSEHKF